MELLIKETVAPAARVRKGKRGKKGKAATRRRVKKSGVPVAAKAAKAAPDSRVEGMLRAWRLAEAARRGVPAFRIFSDATLRAVADKLPATAAELLAIPGIGIGTVEKYGAQLYRILHDRRG